MNQVDIKLTADSLGPEDVEGRFCVVIDVLRATTTTVVALAHGCPSVIPVETPEEARQVARTRNCLLGGERNGLRIEGFDFGNSPLEYLPEKIAGRPIAFTTTNGTRAIRACARSEGLIAASFLNGGAVVRLLEQQTNDILIVCAGTRGKPSLEDTVCGGMLLDHLSCAKNAEAEAAVSEWDTHRNSLAAMMKYDSEHGKSLLNLGFESDIDFAARLDAFDIVPTRQGDTMIVGSTS